MFSAVFWKSPLWRHLIAVPQLNSSTHTCLTAPFPGLPRWARYQKGKTNLDFTEARDSEWQWHQLGHMQVCTSLQTGNHASTPPVWCSFCRPTNSVKALKATVNSSNITYLPKTVGIPWKGLCVCVCVCVYVYVHGCSSSSCVVGGDAGWC